MYMYMYMYIYMYVYIYIIVANGDKLLIYYSYWCVLRITVVVTVLMTIDP